MSHLIEKHQQNNKGRGVITFSPEQIAEFEKRQTPTRMSSDTTSEPARRNKQKQQINEENTLSKRIQRTSGQYKQGKTTPKTAWYSRVTPLVNTDPSGGYHAYNAEQFFKDQTGEEMPTILRPTASDNIRVIEGTNKRVAPHNYSFLSGDNIVGVGGFTNGKIVFDPVKGKATGTMTDVWDIHPFSDERTIWKWGTQHLPRLRKWEAMTAFGGENPTVKITIPNARTQVIHNNTPKSVNTSQYKQYDL